MYPESDHEISEQLLDHIMQRVRLMPTPRKRSRHWIIGFMAFYMGTLSVMAFWTKPILMGWGILVGGIWPWLLTVVMTHNLLWVLSASLMAVFIGIIWRIIDLSKGVTR